MGKVKSDLGSIQCVREKLQLSIPIENPVEAFLGIKWLVGLKGGVYLLKSDFNLLVKE